MKKLTPQILNNVMTVALFIGVLSSVLSLIAGTVWFSTSQELDIPRPLWLLTAALWTIFALATVIAGTMAYLGGEGLLKWPNWRIGYLSLMVPTPLILTYQVVLYSTQRQWWAVAYSAFGVIWATCMLIVRAIEVRTGWKTKKEEKK